MKKLSTIAYLAFFLIGATALWYFGHHRPTQEILKAEPRKIYRPVTPLATDTSAAKKQTAGTDPVHSPPEETLEPSVTEIDKGTSVSSISDVPNTGIQSQNDVEGTKHADTQHEHSHEEAISVSEKFKMMEREHNEIINSALQLSEAALSQVKAGSKEIVAVLNQMPLEEQRAILNKIRNLYHSEVSQIYIPEVIRDLVPDMVDRTYMVDQAWNMLIDSLTEHDYRIPSEWTELQ